MPLDWEQINCKRCQRFTTLMVRVGHRLNPSKEICMVDLFYGASMKEISRVASFDQNTKKHRSQKQTSPST
jgi:hypothetical protein